MSVLMRLFGKSPFAPLQAHMQKVALCMQKMPALFEALPSKDLNKIQLISKEICTLEHEADLTKNDMRNHFPKSLFMPVDRSILLEILSLQDSLADKAEDIAVIATFQPLEDYDKMKEKFVVFCNKNLEAFNFVETIVHEFDNLLESSFGGAEAEKVKDMVEELAHKEHELDRLQYDLLKQLFVLSKEMHFSSFHLWNILIKEIGAISNLAEKLGNRIRMVLDLK